MSHPTRIACSLLVAAALAVPAIQSQAAIVTSLVNAGFDIFDGNSTSDKTVDGWGEGEVFADAANIWNTTFLSGQSSFPNGSGAGSLGLTFNVTGEVPYVFQSIGTVEASDVGTSLSVSVDAQGRRNNGPYSATLFNAFRSGTTTTALGTIQGTAGSRTYAIPGDNNPPLLSVPAGTLEITSGLVGTELFVVLSLENTSANNAAWRQFVVDNLEYTVVVPEPASLALLSVGALLIASRRRADRATGRA